MTLKRVYNSNGKINGRLYTNCPSYLRKEQLDNLIRDFRVVGYNYEPFLYDDVTREPCIRQLTGMKKKKDKKYEIHRLHSGLGITDHGLFCRTRSGRYIGFGLPYADAEYMNLLTEDLREYITTYFQDIVPEMIHCEVLDDKYKYRENGDLVCLIWYGEEPTAKDLMKNL